MHSQVILPARITEGCVKCVLSLAGIVSGYGDYEMRTVTFPLIILLQYVAMTLGKYDLFSHQLGFHCSSRLNISHNPSIPKCLKAGGGFDIFQLRFGAKRTN
jgi:hypothetical protein